MEPYYQDDAVTLYHGRCEDVLPEFAPGTVDVLLTDPPYFQVKDEDWDRQWAKADQFLTWLGDVMDATLPLLSDSASVWMFASPALTSRVEREVIAPRLRLLNSIRWVKEAGWHQKAEVEAQRRYLTAWEGLLLAEPLGGAYEAADWDGRKSVFVAVGDHLRSAREAAGLSREDVAQRIAHQYRNVDSAKARMSAWEVGNEYVSRDAHAIMARIYGAHLRPYDEIASEYERLRSAYEELRRSYEALRRPFNLSRRGPVTDVWDFPPVMGYPGKHPCEKPLSMLAHMIEVSSRPGDLILDPFAGSGSTLRAAKDTGRRAIGIEMDERWCAKTAQRLSQEVFDFGGAA